MNWDWTIDLLYKIPEFLLIGVIVRYYLAKKLATRLEHNIEDKDGWLHKQWDKLLEWPVMARKATILNHYRQEHGGEVASCETCSSVLELKTI